jgi:lipopolysaccharide/colanic/teichoic acid biosynthesis glycosyltransferase
MVSRLWDLRYFTGSEVLLKRVIDFTSALVGLVLLSPLLALAAILVAILDGRPVLFTQVRVGRNGVGFSIFKFRTMQLMNSGPMITVSNDPRITRTGRILRKTKIDELPQLYNVLKGEMSLVGPRPDVTEHVKKYSPQHLRVLNLRPGITSPASLIYANESEILASVDNPRLHYDQVIMPHKNSINLIYADQATVLSDLKWILYTIIQGLGFRPAGLVKSLNDLSASAKKDPLNG